MTIKQMLYFKAITEYGTLTKAADELYISQSTLSKSIAELENELEAELFVRSAKGLVLTECGEKLLEMIIPILHSIENIKPSIDKVSGSGNQTIAIDSYYTFAYEVLCPLLLYMYKNIHLDMKTSERTPEQIIKDVEAGELDCAIIGVREDDSESLNSGHLSDSLEAIHIFTDRLLLAVPKDHNVYNSDKIKAKDIITDRLITNINVGHTDVWFQSLMKKKRLPLKYRHVMEQNYFLKVWTDIDYDFVTESVWASNEHYCSQFSKTKTLIKLDEPEAKEKIYFIYNKNKPYIPPIKDEVIHEIYMLFSSNKHTTGMK